MEYAAAKSTLCRQCGRHFGVVPTANVEAKSVLEFGGVVAAQSLLRRIGGIWHRPRITSVACFDCGTTQELNSVASFDDLSLVQRPHGPARLQD